MDSFFKILLNVFQFIRFVSLGLAVYGLVWLPRFQNGMAKGPHWLLYLYDGTIPILLGIGIVGVIVIFVYNLLIALIPGQSPAGIAGVFRGLLFWIIGIAFIGGLPSFVSQFSHIQEIAFNDDSYHLIERSTRGNTVEYFVYRCTDPIGLWCERVAVTNDLPAPPPTPEPVFVAPPAVEEEGGEASDIEVVTDTEIVMPTPTPPAALSANDEGELLFEVGQFQTVLTYTEPITPLMPSLDGGE